MFATRGTGLAPAYHLYWLQEHTRYGDFCFWQSLIPLRRNRKLKPLNYTPRKQLSGVSSPVRSKWDEYILWRPNCAISDVFIGRFHLPPGTNRASGSIRLISRNTRGDNCRTAVERWNIQYLVKQWKEKLVSFFFWSQLDYLSIEGSCKKEA